MAFGNKRLKNIAHQISQGHWVDPRKWPKQKVQINNPNIFMRGFYQHQRMALLKMVEFNSDPVWINKNFSFPNAFQIATLEEAGIIFLKDNEYAKRKFLTLFNDLGTTENGPNTNDEIRT